MGEGAADEGSVDEGFQIKTIEPAYKTGGSNLLTIAKEREILEMNIGSAPQTRFYNLGINVAF